MSEAHRYIISTDEAGMRLDRWIRAHQPGTPQALVQKLLRKGQIRVDGKRVSANHRVEAGQEVHLPALSAPKPARKKTLTTTKEDAERLLAPHILYQDDTLLVLNKPPGLAAQGGTKVKHSVDALLPHIAPEAKLVHRIDKDTSGILVIAKHAAAARTLTRLFRERAMEKRYWALVVGVPQPRKGVISLKLAAKRSVGKIEKAIVDEQDGKPAKTAYRVVERAGDRVSWVELEPITGRMHQLRVHMAALGHPILGDGKYGGKEAFISGLPEHMHLHAREISFAKQEDDKKNVGKNGVGKKSDNKEGGSKKRDGKKGDAGKYHFTAPLPESLEQTWKLLGFMED